LSESWGQTGGFELFKRETSSELGLGSVLSSLTEDNWSEFADGGNSSGGSLGSSSLESEFLVSWDIEKASNSSLPMLSQVSTLNDIIVFYHVAYKYIQ
jgi:hypothetical protein